jgi:glycosyltransferase involved in cell wall biosynthesis
MRVKLLEALAAGKAVVASPLAAAGLKITDRRELVLADTDEEFAEAIVTLVGDAAARSKIGHNAREWALRNLTWDSRVKEWEQLYRSLLASRAR